MRRFNKVVIAALAVVTACSDNPTGPAATESRTIAPVVTVEESIKVTSSSDEGAGSFRAAIEAANTNPAITSIKFDKDLGPISITEPVTFSGPQALDINGSGNTVDADGLDAGQSGFTATGGGNLTIRRLEVVDAPGVGIKVLIPSTATGIVSVTLKDVTVKNSGLHGVLINDQSGYLIDPLSTSPAGSLASVRVRISGSVVENNGFSDIDQDGVRVNEGGTGDIDAVISHTAVIGNGGDGVELDERGTGSAIFSVEHTQLNRNGEFTPLDYDDGIDVDEAGEGGIDGSFNQVEANDNFEQGIDLNENDAGNLRIFMNKVEASDNDQEGIEFEEDDDFAGGGDIIAVLQSVTTLRNGATDGDAGLKLREKGAGNLTAQIVKPVSSGNFVAGILIREDAAGNLDATVETAVASDNADDGIRFDENSSGNLAGTVLRATASDNDGAGISAEQATTGTGLLRISDLTATGNAAGPVENDSGVTVQYID